MNGKATSGMVQTWQGTSLVMETALTAITWTAMPFPFKIWSVGCLVMDAFIMVREMCLHPVLHKRQQTTQFITPQFNVGMMM
ncbi:MULTISPECIES: hypothetical protein [Bacillus subtilis group]|uniref:hypothetical protein n=1 Tax=Bacillus subtilis group TaxID=653685 RepID=UPI0021D85B65|nr:MULTISPECIES: hypothetical protein [Bacillus subtilis group]MCY9308740.1 hypothetical protein [Bacillus inaquosorum]